MPQTFDLHVVETRPLLTPATLLADLPLHESQATLVATTRDRIRDILQGRDRRLLVIVGPCSIHDVNAALEYGDKLTAVRDRLSDSLEIVMRVYFEKPRTSVGWKGLINDPHLDGSYDINTGLRLARQLLLNLASMGMPAATELLDPIIPQYIADVVSWTAIGARTTESQTHRQMASGLSMPVGFKNGTDGHLDSAINAMIAAQQSHHFLGINADGLASIVATTGNPDTHLVLRGGKDGPNYSAAHIEMAAALLERKGLSPRLMVDCSHANAAKDAQRQVVVCNNIAQQVQQNSRYLAGVMIESHLKAGNQPIPQDLSQLVYGQSITDPCVDFATTVDMLEQLAAAVGSQLAIAH
jgi:3-deoxy-7-phosphoheptulonate synthase